MAQQPSGRPKLWIHRTRRFWFGLLLIVFLWGYVAYTSCYRTEVRRRTIEVGSVEAKQRELSVSMEAGGIDFRRSGMDFPASFAKGMPTWPQWDLDTRKRFRFEPWPQLGPASPEASGLVVDRGLFLPVWPLAVLAMILWPIHLHRADIREAQRFGGASRD